MPARTSKTSTRAWDLHLPHEDFETIGGLTVGLFGRLPHEGEESSADGDVRLRIERTRGRRILAVRVLKDGLTTPDDRALARPDSIDAERV